MAGMHLVRGSGWCCRSPDSDCLCLGPLCSKWFALHRNPEQDSMQIGLLGKQFCLGHCPATGIADQLIKVPVTIVSSSQHQFPSLVVES